MMRVRRLWAGVLAAILLLGALDWHPSGESPHSFLSGAGEVYFPGAEHPEQPVHFDASHAAERPVCPVCLHHRQTTGAHLLPATLLAPPDLESAMPLASDRVNASGSSRSTGARGPPSSPDSVDSGCLRRPGRLRAWSVPGASRIDLRSGDRDEPWIFLSAGGLVAARFVDFSERLSSPVPDAGANSTSGEELSGSASGSRT